MDYADNLQVNARSEARVQEMITHEEQLAEVFVSALGDSKSDA